MPSPRRRVKRYIGTLSQAERFFLASGVFTATDDDSGTFHEKRSGIWYLDERAARAAWDEYRDEITAEMRQGLTPWAAIQFDGARGVSSVYAGLRP